MEAKNIIIAGVGGQGLVLATRMISEVAYRAGYDVKTNDVVGLSQRGGMVWGSVKIGAEVHSPNVLTGTGDILLGMEPLEALRWQDTMKEGAVVVLNTKRIYPTPVLLEEEAYPGEKVKAMADRFQVIEVDAPKEAKAAGNIKAANTILLGILARHLPIPPETFEEVIRDLVPSKALEENLKAFQRGFHHGE